MATSMEPSPPNEPPTAVRSRRRRALWIGAAVGAVSVIAVALWVAGGGTSAPLTTSGKGAAPAFELPDVRDGAPAVRLADYRGTPVVVNFFASWCGPCIREMPAFARVAADVDGQVAFVGVNHQDSRRLGLELLDETGVRYPAAYDPDGSVAADYGLIGMPTTVFVSGDGEILAKRTGEMSEEELRDTLRRLFGV
ncbi:MAG: TlpA family protein disulfide reductase [Actinomycetota bacterium]